jgi:hypothetical protein
MSPDAADPAVGKDQVVDVEFLADSRAGLRSRVDENRVENGAPWGVRRGVPSTG